MKIRKILSLALAMLFVLAVFAVPTMAATHNIPVTKVIDPRDGATELDGTTDRFVLAKTQGIIYCGDVGKDGTLKTEWLVPGFEFAVTYTIGVGTDDSNFNKPISFRLSINEPGDEGGYKRDLPVYPDVYDGNYAVKDNGDGTYTIVFTYADLQAAYADSGRNKYATDDPKYTFEQVLSEATLFTIFTRNIDADTKIQKITVTVPDAGGSTGGSTGGTTGGTTGGSTSGGGTKSPATGDSSMIILAIVALVGSGSAIFFLRKRVKA